MQTASTAAAEPNDTLRTRRHYSTEEAAAALRIKPQTLRAARCNRGHYYGIKPTKGPNRFLAWPADQVDILSTGGGVE